MCIVERRQSPIGIFVDLENLLIAALQDSVLAPYKSRPLWVVEAIIMSIAKLPWVGNGLVAHKVAAFCLPDSVSTSAQLERKLRLDIADILNRHAAPLDDVMAKLRDAPHRNPLPARAGRGSAPPDAS